MILEKQKEAMVHQEGESQESIGMSLDLDSAQILMQMLSKNLYSDSIGSTIRECASNALDSHRRAGVKKPIVVSFKPNENNTYEFSVEDFGIGLDADDVRNIISKYGKSTKRNSNTELGMMGLGFKAPLAYSSSFYFVCRKDGMERKYMMYEGEDTNTIDLLYEKATTEANGVKVIVPVNHYDKRDFQDKIKEQLAYFEDVYFDCLDVVNNNFVIFRGDDFQFSEINTDRYLHICLDNVYYPIDFQKIGISALQFPIALRFSLTDGLFPTPNRESIRYTKEAKEIILKKIGTIADYFTGKYNESVEDTDDIKHIFDYYNSSSRYVKGFSNGNYDISTLSTYASININAPKMKGVELLDLKKLTRVKEYILGEYEVKFELGNRKMSEKKRWNDVDYRYIKEGSHYIYSERISGKMKDYLKSILPSNEKFRFVKLKKQFKLGKLNRASDYNTYISLLELSSYPKSQWRQVIKEFQTILSGITSKFINLDAIEIPQDWIDARKKQRITVSGNNVASSAPRRIKLKGEIVGKKAEKLERYVDGKNCKWVSTTYKLENIHSMGSLVVYGGASDVEKMDALYKLVDGHRMQTKITFIQFSERELKNLETISVHNWMKLETFMKGENKPFKRLVTAYLIYLLRKQNDDVFERRDRLKSISEDLVNKLDILFDYEKKNHYHGNETIYTAMLEIATANNLFDGDIYPIYLEIKALTEKLVFLQPLCDKLNYYKQENDPLIKAIADLFKYYRTRIDWKNYNIKLNDDVVTEVLTEELVEELIED